MSLMSMKRFDNPGIFLSKLLDRNSVIADIGCGRGFYCAYLADYSSMLYCIDIDREALKEAGERLGEKRKTRFRLLSSTSGIRTASVDVVLFANSFHDVEDKEKMRDGVIRILKSSGKIIVVDWEKGGRYGFGPPQSIRMDESDYLEYFKGFKIAKRFEAGKNHFGIVLVRASNPRPGQTSQLA
ncbi:MAG: class I SAM-dependent methyltransferase [Candidatus Micrarchaeales archaeon]|nr:class I SAM-dependent methyltransferase [Candidatus Micrarchaeales archaeon]